MLFGEAYTLIIKEAVDITLPVVFTPSNSTKSAYTRPATARHYFVNVILTVPLELTSPCISPVCLSGLQYLNHTTFPLGIEYFSLFLISCTTKTRESTSFYLAFMTG
jgi:hypothetical protein